MANFRKKQSHEKLQNLGASTKPTKSLETSEESRADTPTDSSYSIAKDVDDNETVKNPSESDEETVNTTSEICLNKVKTEKEEPPSTEPHQPECQVCKNVEALESVHGHLMCQHCRYVLLMK